MIKASTTPVTVGGLKAPHEVVLLVVEDDPFFQRILHKRLTAEGYQVLTAADGREGMKAIVTSEPDLVISDWMMPEVDGLELCQSVKTGLRFDGLTQQWRKTVAALQVANAGPHGAKGGNDSGAESTGTPPCPHCGRSPARVEGPGSF